MSTDYDGFRQFATKHDALSIYFWIYLDLTVITDHIFRMGEGNVFTGVCHSVHNWGMSGQGVDGCLARKGGCPVRGSQPFFRGGLPFFREWSPIFQKGFSHFVKTNEMLLEVLLYYLLWYWNLMRMKSWFACMDILPSNYCTSTSPNNKITFSSVEKLSLYTYQGRKKLLQLLSVWSSTNGLGL